MSDETAEKHQAAVDEAIATGQLLPAYTLFEYAIEQGLRERALRDALSLLQDAGRVGITIDEIERVATFILDGKDEFADLDVEQGRLD